MRNYIILNGKNSNQINGLLIQELPPISKPLLRNQIEEIDGRDGDIVTPLGYSAYDKEFTIGLYKDFDVNEVAAYFNSEGTVIFSNEPDKYYYYQITAQIDFERLVRYRTATVTMHCQPFKYSATEQPITEDVSGTVSDEGTNFALENTAEAPFNTLDLKGNTYQQSYTGKNLIGFTPMSQTIGSLTVSVDENNIITINGTSASSGTTQFNGLLGKVAKLPNDISISYKIIGGTYSSADDYIGLAFKDSGTIQKAYIQSRPNLTGVSGRVTGQPINKDWTIRNIDTTSGSIVYVNPFIVQSNTTYENFKIQIQAVAGTTRDFDFEPYVGGTPSPNPEYPQDIRVVTGENVVKVTGKNILKPSENLHASRQGLTNVVNDDGSITTSGKPTANWSTVVYPSVDITDRLEDGATYTISQRVKTNKLYLQVNARNKNTGTVQYIALNDATSKSFTVDKSSYTYSYIIQSPLITTWGDDTLTITNYYQLEKSSQATDFEPYQEQSYEVNLGKNLFDKNAIETGYYINSSGSLVQSNGLALSDYIPVEPNTPYTYSGSTNEPGYGAKAAWYTADKTWISSIDYGHSGTITAPANAYYFRTSVRVTPGDPNTYQFEKGSTATEYAAFFTPIKLCGLMDTDYRDRIYKNADKWYIHKEIGKYVLTGASQENWYISGQSLKCDSLNDLGYPDMSSEYTFTDRLTTQLYSNYGLVEPAANVFDGAPSRVGLGYKGGGGGTKDAIYVSKGTITAAEDWRALLAATPLICYYALATPTDTEITNKTLIEQLDDIYYHAHAYKGRTHVRSSAATGNMPLVISAEVVEDNESTITNAGNYLSKPRITVYGSGDISLYINDMHVLQIALGDEGYITIDTAQMEAYKDTLDNLKNRLVIGDYSNARLKPGANKIHFTGKVTKYVVEDYSRWL